MLHGEVHPIVLITDEGVYGFVLEQLSGFAYVQYSVDGVQFREYLDNDEFEVIAGITFNTIEEEEE